jgi:hypothetical protein
MCMFTRPSESDIKSGFLFERIVRTVGRLVHRSVKAVVSKAYHWNNAADRR